MDRKEFLKRSVQTAGMCCGAALLGDPAGAQDQTPGAPVSPCDRRVLGGQKVIRRIMNQLDSKLDKATRESIMESCGQACYEGAHGKRPAQKPTREQVEKFLKGMREYVGAEGFEQSGNETVVHFHYTGNPQGLKVSDGYCLCPILEDAPKDISPTFCHCSVGYVKEIFERGLGRPARVEVTETVLRGGKSCRFTITFRT